VGTKAELLEEFGVEDGGPDMEVITDLEYARF
jgi:hypothetical protein